MTICRSHKTPHHSLTKQNKTKKNQRRHVGAMAGNPTADEHSPVPSTLSALLHNLRGLRQQ